VKKALPLLALLIIALGLPAAYYWVGLQAEAVIEAQRVRLQDQYGLRIALLEKNRGIFTSTYRYGVTYEPARNALAGKTPSQAISFDLDEVVHHGPIPLTSGGWTPGLAALDSSLTAREGTPAALTKLLETLPELRKTSLRTTFAFSGDSQTRLTVPPGKRTVGLEDGTALDVAWQGATGLLDVAADASTVGLTLTAPLLGVTDKGAAMTMQGFSLTAQSKLHGQNLYLGDSALSVTGLRIENTKAEDPSFALTNLAMTSNTSQRNDVVDCLLSFRAEGVDLRSQGKAVFDAAFSLKNLDAASLDATLGELRRINLERAAPEVRMGEFQALLLRQAGPIFSKAPRFTVEKLALSLPSGTVEGSGFVAYSGPGTMPQNPLAALGQLSASVAAKASERALLDILTAADKGDTKQVGRQQATAAIGDLILKGFVVRDKDGLSATADWNGKALTVNGASLFQMP